MVNTQARPETIKVTVTFPLAGKPFQDDVDPATTVGTVRAAAMAGFGVAEDPGLLFYLVHASDRIDDAKTVGEIAGHGAAVKFTLTRQIVQG
jgi:hypothetical protein